MEDLVVDVLGVTNRYKTELGVNIPVIAAGGIFDGKDVAKFLRLGAEGVQIATRFVTTHECSVADEFKELYIKAEEKDIVIISSPVGMPGRAIKTKFVDRIMRGEKIPFTCSYKCLRSCDPEAVPYCIARALCNAVIGDLDNAVIFAGSNVAKVKKIVSVKELMDDIVNEAIEELSKI